MLKQSFAVSGEDGEPTGVVTWPNGATKGPIEDVGPGETNQPLAIGRGIGSRHQNEEFCFLHIPFSIQ